MYSSTQPTENILSIQQVEKLKRKNTSLIKLVTSVSRLQLTFPRDISSKVGGH